MSKQPPINPPLEPFIGGAIFEAREYPLTLRIAVKLVDAGITESQFWDWCNKRDPLHLEIANRIRDIYSGRVIITVRLSALARAM